MSKMIRLVVDESITTTYEIEVPDDLDINDGYELGEFWDGVLLGDDDQPTPLEVDVTERWFDAKEIEA